MKIEQPPNFLFFKRTWEANGHMIFLYKKKIEVLFFFAQHSKESSGYPILLFLKDHENQATSFSSTILFFNFLKFICMGTKENQMATLI